MAAPTNPTQRTWFQSLSEGCSSVRNTAGLRLNLVTGKFTTVQNKIIDCGSYCWNQLSPSSQRHIQLVWKRDAGKFVGLESYEKNVIEEVGDWILFPTVDLPPKLRTYQKNPVVIGLVTAGAAFLLLKFIFRPIETAASVVRKISYVPDWAYFFAKTSLIGLTIRSVGRMTNSELMNRFNNPAPQVVEAPPAQ
jgi:hypothetical protein